MSMFGIKSIFSGKTSEVKRVASEAVNVVKKEAAVSKPSIEASAADIRAEQNKAMLNAKKAYVKPECQEYTIEKGNLLQCSGSQNPSVEEPWWDGMDEGDF